MGDWQYGWYYGFHLASGGLLGLMLLTVLWPWSRVRCNHVLTSFCATWLVSAPMMCLLLFTGQHKGPPPSSSVCAASASLVMAQVHLTGTAGLALVAHVYSLLGSSIRHRFTMPLFLNVKLLIIIPYVVFAITVVVVATLGARFPHNLKRSHFYCVYDSNALELVNGVYDALTLVAIITFEILIFISMHRENPSNFADRIEPSLVWRVMVFGFYAVLALGLAIWSAIDWDARAADLIFATFAFGMWCAFGTQKAILERWKNLLLCSCLRPSEDDGLVRKSNGSRGSRGSKSRPVEGSRLPTVRSPPVSARASRFHIPSRNSPLPLRSSNRQHPSSAVPLSPQGGAHRSRTTDGDGSHDVLHITSYDYKDQKSLDPFDASTVASFDIDEIDSIPPVPQKPTQFVRLPPRSAYLSPTPRHHGTQEQDGLGHYSEGGLGSYYQGLYQPERQHRTEEYEITSITAADTRISFALADSTAQSVPAYMR